MRCCCCRGLEVLNIPDIPDFVTQNKCDRYWPENSFENYGPYRVTLIKKEPFADYVIRKFDVEKVCLAT